MYKEIKESSIEKAVDIFYKEENMGKAIEKSIDALEFVYEKLKWKKMTNEELEREIKDLRERADIHLEYAQEEMSCLHDCINESERIKQYLKEQRGVNQC